MWDEDAKKTVLFDESKTTKWWTTESDSDSYWAVAAECDERVEECLYRHESGNWTLVSFHYHLDWGQHKTTAKGLNDSQAAEWLALNGHDLPDDIAELGGEFVYQPKTPAPRDDEPALPKPKWNRETRKLWYGETLCKKFRQGAKNQIAVLEAFELEGWPSKIDDPLTPRPNTDHNQRLTDAVRRLNDNEGGIKFERDGTGEGVLWHPAEDPGKPTATDDDIPF